MKKSIVFIIICIVSAVGVRTLSAKVISTSAPYTNQTVEELNYNRELYDNEGITEFVTTNPDGSRTGRKGETVILYTGGKYYLETCVTGSTTYWRGIELTDTP
jgi:hypothetical protein